MKDIAEVLARTAKKYPDRTSFIFMGRKISYAELDKLTDRFANGDPSNDRGGSSSGDPLVHGYDPTDKGFYHGGDLAGLTQKLDYLDEMGVTAIWMTPMFRTAWVQGEGTAFVSAGYHGYWITDFTPWINKLGLQGWIKSTPGMEVWASTRSPCSLTPRSFLAARSRNWS